ncbi:MAG: M20/M25/M40 family metallo-hydrolase, partial [Anaerolineae bacterium]
LSVEVTELAPTRVNVVGTLSGSGGGQSLMLNGHLDTVGIDGMAEPFSGDIRDGKLYGRGSYDMKGSVAAMLAVAKALVDAKAELKGDLILTFVADEEYASIGTADIAQRYSADAAIVTEPTHFEICIAHRGFIWYDIEVFGHAAHGSLFKEGIDANLRMGRLLAELDKLEQDLRARPPHPLAGPPSMHAAILSGGTEISTYAAHSLLQLERRVAPGETEAQATAELQEIVDRLAAADPTFRATITPTLVRLPYELGGDREIVALAEKIGERHLGKKPVQAAMAGWTDAQMLGAAGIDAILLGPIGDGAHAIEEWVDLDSVFTFAALLADISVEFCNRVKG